MLVCWLWWFLCYCSKWFFPTVDVFALGILGQVCPKLSLWLFGDEGRICCCFSLLSFHLEVVIVGLCLAYHISTLGPWHVCFAHFALDIFEFVRALISHNSVASKTFFFQDLWANQCCCTDRFSPISTVPSDENIVDWAEALWDLPHQAALRKRRTWPNAVSVAAPSGPCPKNGGRILACGPNSLCSCVAWRMSSFLIFQNPFDEPSSRLCRLPAGCE